VEGWVDLGTAVRVHNPCARLYVAVTVMINMTICQGVCVCVCTCVGMLDW